MTDVENKMNDEQQAANNAPAIGHKVPPHEQPPMKHPRWWLQITVRPLLFLVSGAMLIAGLGVAQRQGWISAGGSGDHQHASAGEQNVRYICPMMCTAPQSEPGRCPVCAMELVPATSGGDTDGRSIQIDPAARRVANIRTSAVQSIPMIHTIRAIGELRYDEGTRRTISAYVDGRLDRLFADYTGMVVQKGDHLALVYSPRLYSSQVELLLAKQAWQKSESSVASRVVRSSKDIYESAKQRLIELGMTEPQIVQLEQAGKANSRLHLCAPISGTVIEKFAVEGAYVKEGQPIYQLADLSTVWLMLELFPEDAATVRYGQKVEAEVQSLPGQTFVGRVAFVDPNVDPRTRTVGVRVVIPNHEGLLRVGDYAKAIVQVPVSKGGVGQGAVYDPELANKWISPRHPHIVESSPGACRVCGVALVPATQFGFANAPTPDNESLVVPRESVLMAGNSSVVYVESAPGHFEIRRVVLGPTSGDQIAILSGVSEGEQVAMRGNFLIDSQMQLAGNPSLIDPTKAGPLTDEDQVSAAVIAALSSLSEEDRLLAQQQRICPITDFDLGSMGTPTMVDVNGTPVFICCEGCREDLLNEPDKYLAKIAAGPPPRVASDNEVPSNLPPMGVPQMPGLPEITPPVPSVPMGSRAMTTTAEDRNASADRMGQRLDGGLR